MVRQGGPARACTSASARRIPADVQERANFEIEVIADKGYPGYFLVVADFVKWSKDNGIRVGPGRGSGAGSMAAYAMRITDLDPIVHQLYFERFLNPERESKPDFDIDFDERRRGEVIRYVTEKYGEDKVAQIVTYGTIKAKQALKDSARVLGKPYALGEQLTKAYPEPQQGRDLSLAGRVRREERALQRGRRLPPAASRPIPRRARSPTWRSASRGSSASGACTRRA